VLLTKIWASILAFLATAFLAGMFLLSLGTPGGFSDADRAAIRAVTEAGLAALRAEIESSPVQRAPALLTDARLKEALERPEPDEDLDPEAAIDVDAPPLSQVLADVAEENLLGDNPQMTVGLVDSTAKTIATSGIAEPLIDEAVGTTAYKAVAEDSETLFSAALGGQLHVVKVSRSEEQGRRLVAIQALPTGAGSLLRRVLGTQSPAAMIRNNKLLGDIIGDLQVGTQIETLASENAANTPDDGASEVFRVGDGLNARVGAIGRVPGPAGRGPSGAMLVVLSRNTAAAGQQDVAEAVRTAVDQGLLGRLNWPILGAILVVGLGLAWYLPLMEVSGPLKRLVKEFEAMSQGQQHQLFHDRYSGAAGDLARAAAATHEAIHAAYLTGDVDDLDEEEEDTAVREERKPRKAKRGRTGDNKPKTGDNKPKAPPSAIELPSDDDAPAEVERHSHEPEAAPEPESSAPAPTLTDDVGGAEAAALGFGLAEPEPAAPPPAPEPEPEPEPASAAPTDPREAYFKGIYEEFVQVKMACGESVDKFPFDKFAAKLRKNTAALMQKPGVTDVEFSVYIKDGKAALKAKVVKA
jgi:hypothetical protein